MSSFPWNSFIRFPCPVIETPVLHIHKAGGVQYVPSPSVLVDYIVLDYCGFDATAILFEYRRNSHRNKSDVADVSCIDFAFVAGVLSSTSQQNSANLRNAVMSIAT